MSAGRRFSAANSERWSRTSGTLLDRMGDYTVLFGARFRSTDLQFGLYSNFCDGDNYEQFAVGTLFTGNFELWINGWGSGTSGSATGGALLVADTDYFLACVRSGDTCTWWVDGVEDVSATLANSTSGKNTVAESMGCSINYDGTYYQYADVVLSRVVAYNVALTGDEIRAQMDAVLPQRWANLHEYWPVVDPTQPAAGFAFGRNWTETNTPTEEDAETVPWGGVTTVTVLLPPVSGIVGTAGYDDADAFGTGGLINLQVTGTAGHADADAFGTGGVIALQVTGTAGHDDADAFGSGGSVSLQVAGTAGHEDPDAFGSGGVIALQVTGTAGHEDADAFGSGGTISLQVTGTAGHEDPDAFGTGGEVGDWGVTGVTGYEDPDAFGANGVLTLQVVGVAGYDDPDTFGAGGQVGVGIAGVAGYADPDAFGTGGGIWLFDEDTPVLPLLGSFEPVTLLSAQHRTTLALLARHRPVLNLEARA